MRQPVIPTFYNSCRKHCSIVVSPLLKPMAITFAWFCKGRGIVLKLFNGQACRFPGIHSAVHMRYIFITLFFKVLAANAERPPDAQGNAQKN